MRILWVVLLVALLSSTGLLAVAGAERKTLRVYHVGNSVTDTLRYPSFAKLVASRGHQYVWGRHMIPGAPLMGMYVDQKGGFFEKPYGASQEALKNFDWDVVTLQPFDRQLEGDPDSDLPAASAFIDLIVARNPQTQIYLYSRWPRRDEVKGSDPIQYIPLDYESTWVRPYTGKWDRSYETRDYFQKLTDRLNEKYAGKLSRPIQIIPVGDVMLELDRRIKAGQAKGMSAIDELYVDHIHLSAVGSYLVGATFFATLYGEPAQGLSPTAYGRIDAGIAEAITASVDAVVHAEKGR
jgi:hypothetical protein